MILAQVGNIRRAHGPETSMRIGIDLGGTKIEVIALDACGATLVRRRMPTPCGDYQAILDTVADLVAFVERQTDRCGMIGVANALRCPRRSTGRPPT